MIFWIKNRTLFDNSNDFFKNKAKSLFGNNKIFLLLSILN